MPAIIENEGALLTRPAPAGADPVEAVLAAAESALGVMYRWGGNSLASGVDCSGLVQQAFRAAGIVLPRVSAQQARAGMPVASIEDARPGDLISWDNSSRNQGADHIAIYLGDGKMIEAPRRGKPVRISQVRPNARFNRVLGVVKASTGVAQPKLGPHKGRENSQAAVANAPVPATVVPDGPEEQQAMARTGGGFGDDLPDDATDDQIKEYIRKHYSDVSGFLANAEIKKLLFESARAGEDHIEVLARLRQTNYWRTHGPESRAFDLLLSQDRKSAERLIDDRKNSMRDLMLRNGITMTEDELGEAAKLAIRGGWDDADIGRWIGSELRERQGQGALPAGETSLNADGLGAMASQYGITIPRSALEDWAIRLTEGTASESTFQSYLADLARREWDYDPDVVKAIGKGIAPKTYFAPHQQAIADALELGVDEVDLFGDPRWKDVTQFYDPALNGGKGGRRAMTKGEAALLAKSSPEFEKTEQFRTVKSDTELDVARWAGLVA